MGRRPALVVWIAERRCGRRAAAMHPRWRPPGFTTEAPKPACPRTLPHWVAQSLEQCTLETAGLPDASSSMNHRLHSMKSSCRGERRDQEAVRAGPTGSDIACPPCATSMWRSGQCSSLQPSPPHVEDGVIGGAGRVRQQLRLSKAGGALQGEAEVWALGTCVLLLTLPPCTLARHAEPTSLMVSGHEE